MLQKLGLNFISSKSLDFFTTFNFSFFNHSKVDSLILKFKIVTTDNPFRQNQKGFDS